MHTPFDNSPATADGTKKRVLVCPLDWGMGHATRCIPLIQELLKQNAEVLIAAAPLIKPVLQSEFPTLEYIDIHGYEVQYAKRKPLWLKLLQQLPRLIKCIKQEHAWLQQTIPKHYIDVVISDNRYGLHSNKATCVFITHQLFIPSPFMGWLIQRINYHFIKKYQHCWIPDSGTENNLSGALSHRSKKPKNVNYIGILSRFKKPETFAEQYAYDFCVLLSGPEPQRSMLEKRILTQCIHLGKKVAFIRGTLKGKPLIQNNPNIELIDYAGSTQLQYILERSRYVICRSGYSTLMDLALLQKKVILIPTPGQWEQEYLALHLQRKFGCKILRQHKINELRLFEETGLKQMQPLSVERFQHLPELVTTLLKNSCV